MAYTCTPNASTASFPSTAFIQEIPTRTKLLRRNSSTSGSFSNFPLTRPNTSLPTSQLLSEVAEEKDEDAIRLQHHIPQVHQLMEIMGRIGEGTFSYVYKARLKSRPDLLFALKYIIPTSHPSRIVKELKCLKDIGGEANVVELKTCFLHKGHVAIVMPYFPHDRFSDYVRQLSVSEVREYMRNLFLALDRVHSFKIVHRDIKPSNFLFNRSLKKYALVDFGLAEKVEFAETKCATSSQATSQQSCSRKRLRTDQENMESKVKRICLMQQASAQCPSSPALRLSNQIAAGISKAALNSTTQTKLERRRSEPVVTVKRCFCFGRNEVCNVCMSRPAEVAPRAGTPGFRAPEVLMKYRYQSTAIDIWSAAVIYLSLLSGRYPFFRAQDDLTALAEIITLLGSDRAEAAADGISKKLTTTTRKPAIDLANLCMSLRGVDNKPRQSQVSSGSNNVHPSWYHVSPSAFDLLYKVLDPNPFTRYTAAQALAHPFFNS